MHERAPAAELTEEQIGKICERYGFSSRIFGNDIFVTTGFGKWIVRLKNGNVFELRHGNTHSRKRGPVLQQKITEEYHEQKLPSEDFEEVISYINNHDKNMLKRMSRKTRLECLFEQIEEKQKTCIEK